MSVLIRGMEMRKYPIVIRAQIDPDGIVWLGCLEKEGAWVKQESVKAVPVPPHGRLIDADEFFKALTMDDRVSIPEALHVQSILSDAPTIIPADPEEEEMK